MNLDNGDRTSDFKHMLKKPGIIVLVTQIYKVSGFSIFDSLSIFPRAQLFKINDVVS